MNQSREALINLRNTAQTTLEAKMVRVLQFRTALDKAEKEAAEQQLLVCDYDCGIRRLA